MDFQNASVAILFLFVIVKVSSVLLVTVNLTQSCRITDLRPTCELREVGNRNYRFGGFFLLS